MDIRLIILSSTGDISAAETQTSGDMTVPRTEPTAKACESIAPTIHAKSAVSFKE